MNGIEARTYRFGDANRPGLVLGLSTRQAVPMIAGVLWLAGTLQTPLPWPVGLVGPAAGLTVAFGRLRGSPLAETVVPGIRLVALKRFNRHRWVQPPLLGEGDPALPEAMPRSQHAGGTGTRRRYAGLRRGTGPSYRLCVGRGSRTRPRVPASGKRRAGRDAVALGRCALAVRP